MALVTISRHFGADGHTLGDMTCEKFGFHLVDASVIEALAKESKMNPNWLTAMEKEASSTILNFISKAASRGLFLKTPGATKVTEKAERLKYINFLTQTFTAMANEGGYVIIGRGAQFILKNHPKVLHVLLVAEYESRIDFLVNHHHISRAEAEKTIRAREKERTAMVSRLFEADIDDPCHYHLVLNTSQIPYEWAKEILFQLVSRFLEREG